MQTNSLSGRICNSDVTSYVLRAFFHSSIATSIRTHIFEWASYAFTGNCN